MPGRAGLAGEGNWGERALVGNEERKPVVEWGPSTRGLATPIAVMADIADTTPARGDGFHAQETRLARHESTVATARPQLTALGARPW